MHCQQQLNLRRRKTIFENFRIYDKEMKKTKKNKLGEGGMRFKNAIVKQLSVSIA